MWVPSVESLADRFSEIKITATSPLSSKTVAFAFPYSNRVFGTGPLAPRLARCIDLDSTWYGN
ncbi:hypothetical protein J6590_049771 [Homalodisca vitripennis]|nr:hypothetical protein J6590_049771 [Homalodisca vitripennis]